MATSTHEYETTVRWTGNLGTGTSGYRDYSRDHEVSGEGLPVLPGSAEPGFRGDGARWNPEQMLVASLSQCHLLWYLHLCSVEGVVVTAYEDHAHGAMAMAEDGGGEFTEATLSPVVTVADESMAAAATALHERAHELCFIARSVRFPVRVEPQIKVNVPQGGG